MFFFVFFVFYIFLNISRSLVYWTFIFENWSLPLILHLMMIVLVGVYYFFTKNCFLQQRFYGNDNDFMTTKNTSVENDKLSTDINGIRTFSHIIFVKRSFE